MCKENLAIIFENVVFFLLILSVYLAFRGGGGKSLTPDDSFPLQSDWFWFLLFILFPELKTVFEEFFHLSIRPQIYRGSIVFLW